MNLLPPGRPVPNLTRVWLVSLVLLFCLFGQSSARAEGDVADCTEEAFLEALAGGGLVTFSTDCSITLTAPIIIDSDTTIDAQENVVTISGGDEMLIFLVESNAASLTLIGVTLTGGQNRLGGAIKIGEDATVVLENCQLHNNSALGDHGVDGIPGSDSSNAEGGDGTNGSAATSGRGGAIYNLGDLTVINSIFSTNTAAGGDGGDGGDGGMGGGSLESGGDGGNGGTSAPGYGGAIYNEGILSVIDCTFSNNIAFGGHGGLGGVGGEGFINGLDGSGTAGSSGAGAGIYSTAPIGIMNSTFFDNFAEGGESGDGGTSSDGNGVDGPPGGSGLGAGIAAVGGGALTNCTFFENTCSGGSGGNGGIATRTLGLSGDGGNGGIGSGGGLYSAGGIDVVNCTFLRCGVTGGTNGLGAEGRFPGEDGNPGPSRGGNIARNGGVFWLKNSIVATNLSGGNGHGTIADGGQNISSDGSIALGAMSKKNTNPRVGTLADNGGPTLTIALLTNSPAIDAADDSAAPDFDQRGMVRPNGPRSDIGAFETSFQPTVSIQVLEGTNALAGVTIAIGSNVVVTTGADGRVSTNLAAGTYTITPSLANFAFQPPSVEVEIPPGTNIVFTAVGAFSISGQVLEGAAGLSGATVSADAFTAVTGPDGTYTINGVPAGTYFVFASLAGYRFSAAQEVTVGPHATGVNFYVSNRLFTISGTVLEGTNGLSGVTFQEFASLTTDSNGVFRISNLQPDTYTFTPRKIGTTYGFDPATRTVVLTTQDVTNVDFQAGILMASLSIMEDGQVSFSVLGQPATNCVEVSSNLVDWEIVSTNITPFQFIDSDATNHPIRYYRTFQQR